MRHAPAAERNKAAITEVLRRVLPTSGTALEVASGSGQHVVAFAASLPRWSFVPSDPDSEARTSIDAWVEETGVGNVATAAALDTRSWPWPVTTAEAVIACNMIHISPWAATEGLLAGAGRLLSPGGVVVLYGPYVIDGVTAPSNLAFDQSLRARDSSWGVRELRDIEAVATAAGLMLQEVVPMPANNHCLVLTPSPSSK